jgi:hypothetical protein
MINFIIEKAKFSIIIADIFYNFFSDYILKIITSTSEHACHFESFLRSVDPMLDLLFFPPGLPDGIFSYQKSQFGLILEALVGIFYSHMVYFTAIWYFVWLIGKFFRFDVLYLKNLATLHFFSSLFNNFPYIFPR